MLTQIDKDVQLAVDIEQGRAERKALKRMLDNAPVPSKQEDIAFIFCPGFMSGDKFLLPAREYMQSLGFQVYESGVVRKLQVGPDTLRKLKKRVKAVREELPDTTKLFLIGHSAGANNAHIIAHKAPELIDGVFCLAGTFNEEAVHEFKTPHTEVYEEIIELATGQGIDIGSVPKAPMVTFSSNGDFLKPTEISRIYHDSVHHIEVEKDNLGNTRGPSHLGLVFNQDVLDMIAAQARSISSGP